MEIFWINAKIVAALVFGIVLAFLLPLVPFLGMVFVLVAVDLITGVRAAKARKETITSGGLKRTIEKICLYFAAIILSEGMVQVFFPGLPLTYVVAAYIALTEFKSNIENISDVTGVDLWKRIVSKIGLHKLLNDKAKEHTTDASKLNSDSKTDTTGEELKET
jgi:hypothetical protein